MVQIEKTIIKDKHSALSVYQQIEAQMRGCIQTGQWHGGEMIPSRRDLAKQYAVNAKTIQRALEPMLADGTLRAEQGRGTFVAQKTLSSDYIFKTAQLPGLAAPVILDSATVIGIITLLGSDLNESGSEDAWRVLISNSLERAVTEAGATSYFFNRFRPGNIPYTLEESVELLYAEGMDGLVFVMPVDEQEIATACALADRKKLPKVFVNTTEIHLPVPAVFCGDRHAGYQAADHLLQRGCPDVLFFAPFRADWVDLRLAGAREAFFLKGLPSHNLHVFIDDISVFKLSDMFGEDGSHDRLAYLAAQILLEKGLPAKGIIAVNDYCAIGFHQAAAEAGYIVGKDYALVGFDDLPKAQFLGITSLHPPLERLGLEATRAIMRVVNGDNSNTQTGLNFNVVARRSSQLQRRRPVLDAHPFSHLENLGHGGAL